MKILFGLIAIFIAVAISSVALYILNHHSRQMRKSMREDFGEVFASASSNQKADFKNAASMILAGLSDPKEKEIYKSRMDLAETNYGNEEPEYCFTLYQLIRDHTTGKVEAANEIDKIRITQNLEDT